jgi:GH25 family lysozyme M1 (1,4-beta-N-acetylmuramidase)
MMDYEGARAAGLEVGAYFYTYSTTIEGIEKDALDLLSYIKGKKFEYPIYLDLEDPSLSSLGKNNLSAMCEVFLCTLQENGYYAGLYTNHTWLTTILDTARMVTLFDIWYARYPLSEKPTWNEEKYGKQLGMWQYTESGEIDGLEGSFDLNYAYKDYKEIMQKWRLNGF